MKYQTKPTIQEVIDQAKYYFDQGISQSEAIRLAIAASTPGYYAKHTPKQVLGGYVARPN
ncbi:hypothetical protein [Spirosoma panaciterrae]|uniref:hypothetical protein n=1 Tax=Spirosoma panaciterrae TaxID=496058 RepID=UPI0003671840|nr:hypothetical protein [Spirosoma panaciterrae]